MNAGSDPRFHIVLVEPEIAPNTGNIARLCAVTGAVLHLVEPLGFALGDRELKRAGMDYWKLVDWRCWSNWQAFEAALPADAKVWFIEGGGPRRYIDATFNPDDYLVFGRETAGLPQSLLDRNPDRWLRIPMIHPEARSLNLANCAAIVLYEISDGGNGCLETVRPDLDVHTLLNLCAALLHACPEFQQHRADPARQNTPHACGACCKIGSCTHPTHNTGLDAVATFEWLVPSGAQAGAGGQGR